MKFARSFRTYPVFALGETSPPEIEAALDYNDDLVDLNEILERISTIVQSFPSLFKSALLELSIRLSVAEQPQNSMHRKSSRDRFGVILGYVDEDICRKLTLTLDVFFDVLQNRLATGEGRTPFDFASVRLVKASHTLEAEWQPGGFLYLIAEAQENVSRRTNDEIERIAPKSLRWHESKSPSGSG